MSNPPIATDVAVAAPKTLGHMIGQHNAKETLEVAVRAYWNDRAAGLNPSPGPFLFAGPPGTGKTMAARILAAELGLTNFREALGQTFGSTLELHRWLLDSDPSTALFIDECATLSPTVQHELLIAVEEKRVMLTAGSSERKTRVVPLDDPVFIFATTNPEDLLPALMTRMRVECRFDYYDAGSLTLIVKQRADACRWPYESEQMLARVAACSKQTPRLAMKLLSAVWRVCRSEDANVMTTAHLEDALRLEQLDDMGLDVWQQRYLSLLAEGAVEVRLGVIASTLGLPVRSISHVVEPFLLRQRLIVKTERGRSITDMGIKHLQGESPNELR